jgi:hypothetical protein
MKRFINELTSTTPFINSDFHDILQEQHLIAYRAYLEGLNDVPNQGSGSDRGIIIKGCQTTAVNFNAQTSTYTYTIDFTDSLVYFDGNFYTPKKDIIENITQTITGANPQGELGIFYIVPLTETITRLFKSGLTQSFSTDYIFDVDPKSTQPTTTPYIKFSFGGTSRRLSRLLRYNSANAGDIYTSYDATYWTTTTATPYQIWRDFDNNGNGRNEMKGFQLSHSLGGRFPVGYGPTYATTPQSVGLFDSNYGLPGNIGGTISLTFSSSQLPTHDHGGITKDLTSTGISLASFGVADHTHPFYAQSIFGLITDPESYVSDESQDFDGKNRPVAIAMGVKTPSPSPTQKFLTRKVPLAVDYPFSTIGSNTTDTQWYGNYQRQAGSPPPTPDPVVPGVEAAPGDGPDAWNDHINAKDQVWQDPTYPDKSVININLSIPSIVDNSRYEKGKEEMLNHFHKISTTGLDSPHENRPPYQVVLYYHKL